MHTIETPFGEPGFLVLAGSRLFGMHTPESDYDYVGALIEPVDYRVGLKKHLNQHGFEQHQFKPAPDGGNYEGSVYSLWKLASMFADGNPTILALMFADPIRDDYGICTPEFRKIVASKRSGHRFLKYMEAQRKSMTGERASHTKRPELQAAYGYDTKFAAHVIRLGYQGMEFLETGKITHPMPPEVLQVVQFIRAGNWQMSSVEDLARELEHEIEQGIENTSLPDEADWNALNDWVVGRYETAWY